MSIFSIFGSSELFVELCIFILSKLLATRRLTRALVCYGSDAYLEHSVCAPANGTLGLRRATSVISPNCSTTPNASLQLETDSRKPVCLLDEQGSSSIDRVHKLSKDFICIELVGSRNVHTSASNRTSAPASTGLIDTETAFGASLGTMVIMASIVIAYLWAKLISKRTQLRRVQLELDAMRDAKPEASGAGRVQDNVPVQPSESIV